MEDKPIVYIVATQCQPELEEKFNTWYNETHIPMILKFKGIGEATRYKIINEAEGAPKYLATYEFESQKTFEAYIASPERAAAIKEANETWKRGEFQIKWWAQYEVVKTWKR